MQSQIQIQIQIQNYHKESAMANWLLAGGWLRLLPDGRSQSDGSPFTLYFPLIIVAKTFLSKFQTDDISLLLNVTQTCVDKHLMRIYSKCFHKRVLRHL